MSETFRATEAEVRHLIATAVNASRPAGMGFLHATNRVFTADDFQPGTQSVDYVEGRMVKLHVQSVGNDEWRIGEPEYVAGDIERTYQSWGGIYPTAAKLIEAAGLQQAPS